MAARKKKSGSRRPAAKKTLKMRKPRVAAKKKAAKKAPKRKVAAKKKVARPAKKRATAKLVFAPKPDVAPAAPPPPAAPPTASVTELDNRIAIVRANLRELVDQAASSAGAANEELLSQRIAEQEERLRRLRQEREQQFPE
jgi:hypothetical protein